MLGMFVASTAAAAPKPSPFTFKIPSGWTDMQAEGLADEVVTNLHPGLAAQLLLSEFPVFAVDLSPGVHGQNSFMQGIMLEGALIINDQTLPEYRKQIEQKNTDDELKIKFMSASILQIGGADVARMIWEVKNTEGDEIRVAYFLNGGEAGSVMLLYGCHSGDFEKVRPIIEASASATRGIVPQQQGLRLLAKSLPYLQIVGVLGLLFLLLSFRKKEPVATPVVKKVASPVDDDDSGDDGGDGSEEAADKGGDEASGEDKGEEASDKPAKGEPAKGEPAAEAGLPPPLAASRARPPRGRPRRGDKETWPAARACDEAPQRMLSRRALLKTAASAAAGVGAAGCSPRRMAPGEVSLWFSYGGKNREVLLDLVKRFNATQGRYRVVPTYQGDYFEALAKVRTALSAGLAPALTHVVGEVLPYLAEASALEPLSGYEGAGELGFIEALAQEGSYHEGGKRPLWGVPFNRSTPIMYLNGDLLKGRKAPATWGEMRELAAALTDRPTLGGRWGYEVPISWWFWVALVGQAGGRVVEPSGEATLGGEAGVKALQLWQRMAHEDRTMRPPPGRDYNAWQVTNQDFLAGRAGFIWTSTAFLRYLEENAKFPVVAAPLPRDVASSVPTGGTFFVMMRQAPREEKEAGWAFLRWMCRAEQAMEWATRTGYLPITKGAVRALEESGFYQKHPNDRVAYDQLASAQPWPWAPSLFRVQRQVVEPRLEAAVLKNLPAAAVMAEARAASGEEP